MKKTLGTVITYHGNEHRYLRDTQVRIIAVYKNAARGLDRTRSEGADATCWDY